MWWCCFQTVHQWTVFRIYVCVAYLHILAFCLYQLINSIKAVVHRIIIKFDFIRRFIFQIAHHLLCIYTASHWCETILSTFIVVSIIYLYAVRCIDIVNVKILWADDIMYWEFCVLKIIINSPIFSLLAWSRQLFKRSRILFVKGIEFLWHFLDSLNRSEGNRRERYGRHYRS